MCQFGDKSKIISEKILPREEALVGYRNWYIINSFNDKEKSLKSINMEFLWPKKEEIKGNPTEDNSEGIYNYSNYYYSNYYYYNYNNNYYYNNYYYYYNYNYNNNNNYYYICGKTLLYGKVFSYKEGYRSSLCVPTHLVILSDKRWFEDKKSTSFAKHFNEIVSNLAKEYDCEVIGYNEFMKGNEK